MIDRLARIAVVSSCALVCSAAPSATATGDDADPIARHFVSPEQVMRHQDDLGLTSEQAASIRADVAEATRRFAALEWDVQREMGRLAEQIAADRPDEERVLDQLDRVLAIEREMKRAQIRLLIRIKSRLTPEQFGALKRLEAEGEGGG